MLRILRNPANQNQRWERMDEYIALRKQLFGDDDSFRASNISHRSLENFLWFFKFEVAFREAEAVVRRDGMELVHGQKTENECI